MKTKNNNNNKITLEEVNTSARQATLSTLKRIYSASGEQKIYQLYLSLIQDFNIIDNGKMDNISDGYDLYLFAYDYLFTAYKNNQNFNDVVTISLKNGNTKNLTVFQNACRLVRQEIYKHSDNNKSNYLYINDFSAVDDEGNIESFADTCDRLIRINHYFDIDNYDDYTTSKEFAASLNLKPDQEKLLYYRQRGLSISDIAEKLGVCPSTITRRFEKIQKIVIAKYPNKVRQFKEKRQYK